MKTATKGKKFSSKYQSADRAFVTNTGSHRRLGEKHTGLTAWIISYNLKSTRMEKLMKSHMFLICIQTVTNLLISNVFSRDPIPIHNCKWTNTLVGKKKVWLTGYYMNLPATSLSTHTAATYSPGSTRFLSISVPVAVAFITQTWAASKASCPWSPHSLYWNKNINILQVFHFCW